MTEITYSLFLSSIAIMTVLRPSISVCTTQFEFAPQLADSV